MPPIKNGSLGRGLGDLISGIPSTIGSAATLSSTGFVRLSPDLIGFTPEQESRAQEVAGEFVESVRKHGILQPILVRRRTQGYEVVVGARRLVAARMAGLKEIPAVVIQATEDEGHELSKVENTCREPVNPVSVETAPVVTTVAEAEVTGRWNPVRVMGWCGAAMLLLMLGVGVGLGFGRRVNDAGTSAPGQASGPVVVEPVVMPIPEIMKLRPKLDISELQALESDGLTVIIGSNGLAQVAFEDPLFSSRATLVEKGSVLLEKMGTILAKHGEEWDVLVTGHTDAIPLRGNGFYKDNKELGLARATEVMRYLMREAKVPSAMLRAATAGEGQPPFPGDDADARRKNRTVTLQVKLCQ